MRVFDKIRKEKTFCKHPIEPCVVRTVPAGLLYEVYVRFSGRDEYKPAPGSKIISEVSTAKEVEWITEKEYYDF